MQNDTAVGSDLLCFADDDCPHLAETQSFEPYEAWSSLDADMGDSPFALAFDSGGEG